MRAVKIIALFVIAQITLAAGNDYGPISRLPMIVEVNEMYFAVVRRHFLFLGLFTGLSVGLANFLTKLPFKDLFWIVFTAGATQYAWHLSAEPDFIQYLVGALFDFLVIFLPVAVIVLGMAWLAQKRIQVDHDARTG